jgi:hypothetical protein
MLEVALTSIHSSSQKGMRTHHPSVSRSRRDTPSVGSGSGRPELARPMSQLGRFSRFDGDPANGRNRRNPAVRTRHGEGPESTPSRPSAQVPSVRFYPLAPSPGGDHVDPAAAASRADQPLAPIENRRCITMPMGQLAKFGPTVVVNTPPAGSLTPEERDPSRPPP